MLTPLRLDQITPRYERRCISYEPDLGDDTTGNSSSPTTSASSSFETRLHVDVLLEEDTEQVQAQAADLRKLKVQTGDAEVAEPQQRGRSPCRRTPLFPTTPPGRSPAAALAWAPEEAFEGPSLEEEEVTSARECKREADSPTSTGPVQRSQSAPPPQRAGSNVFLRHVRRGSTGLYASAVSAKRSVVNIMSAGARTARGVRRTFESKLTFPGVPPLALRQGRALMDLQPGPAEPSLLGEAPTRTRSQ